MSTPGYPPVFPYTASFNPLDTIPKPKREDAVSLAGKRDAVTGSLLYARWGPQFPMGYQQIADWHLIAQIEADIDFEKAVGIEDGAPLRMFCVTEVGRLSTCMFRMTRHSGFLPHVYEAIDPAKPMNLYFDIEETASEEVAACAQRLSNFMSERQRMVSDIIMFVRGYMRDMFEDVTGMDLDVVLLNAHQTGHHPLLKFSCHLIIKHHTRMFSDFNAFKTVAHGMRQAIHDHMGPAYSKIIDPSVYSRWRCEPLSCTTFDMKHSLSRMQWRHWRVCDGFDA